MIPTNVALHQDITSPESLVSTVKTDFPSYGWFACLVRCPAIRARLSDGEAARGLYQGLDATILGQKALWALFLFLLAEAALFGHGLLITGALATVLAAQIYLHVRKRRVVARLCAILFGLDFQEQQFSRKTLYQIGEYYAGQYGILPLVDAIAFTDRAVWTAFLTAVFICYFIYPMGIGHIITAVTITVYGVRALVNTPLIYNWLR